MVIFWLILQSSFDISNYKKLQHTGIAVINQKISFYWNRCLTAYQIQHCSFLCSTSMILEYIICLIKWKKNKQNKPFAEYSFSSVWILSWSLIESEKNIYI